jgi:hypothetical protein
LTQNARVLELLSDGRSHSHLELYALGVVAHSRVSELRRRFGFVVEVGQAQDAVSGTVYVYRLVGVPSVRSGLEEQLEAAGAWAAVERLGRIRRGLSPLGWAGLPSPASPG